MNVQIRPSKPFGSIVIPPSKSIAHRAIICACLAEGVSVLNNIDTSEDMHATISAMECIGAKVTRDGKSLTIRGVNNQIKLIDKEINCIESGSTLRFLIPLLSLANEKVTFVGRNRLLHRPQSIYQKLYDERNIPFTHTAEKIEVEGALKSGLYELDGDVSSQFITGLLFTLPLLDGDSTIKIKAPFESKSYVDLTLQTLADFGVHLEFKDDLTLFIKGNQSYQAREYSVEGDFSQFAFFAALGAIKGEVECLGMRHDSLQGDKEIVDILMRMNANITEIENGYKISQSKLKATQIDLANCPDLGPILCVLSMYAQGQTHIINASRLRIKESDRIASMEEELAKFGVSIRSTENELFIEGGKDFMCTSDLSGHKDHRIAMSLSIASACNLSETMITGAECVNKSYPAFFEDCQKANISLIIKEENS